MSGPELLLHVEDDGIVSRAVARVLRPRGFRVVSVHSCEAARKLADVFRFGVFDVDLPDGDGIALAGELLGCGMVQSVIFYTGTTDSTAAERAAQVGAVAFKSAGVDALIDWLGDARAQSEFPPPHSQTKPRPKANAS